MPTLKKVTKIASKDQEKEHEVISLKKMNKPPHVEEQTQLGIILKSVEKTETYEKRTEIYSEAVSGVTITSRFESEESPIPYGVTKRTETMSSSLEKKTEEQVKVSTIADDLPKIATEKSSEVVDKTAKDEKTEEKHDVKKTQKKTLKEDQPDTPSLVKKKVTKLPLKEQEQETVKLKPFAKPDKPDGHEFEKTIKSEDREHATFHRSERTLKDKPATEQGDQFPVKQQEMEVRTEEKSLVGKDEKVEEKVDIKKSKTPKVEEESKTPSLVRKKISKLPSDEKEQEIVKLKPLPSKEVEKPVQDSVVDGKEREQIAFSKGERPLKDETFKDPLCIPSELAKSSITEKPPFTEQHEQAGEKAGVKKSKTPKDEETKAPGLVRKKISKLPSSETEPEVVKLKPFDKPAKQDTDKERKDSIKESKEREPITFKKSERSVEDDTIKKPVAEKIQPDAPKDTAPEKPPVSDKVCEVQKVEERAAVKKAKTPKDEEPKAPGLAPMKISKLPSSEKGQEIVKLKPVVRPGEQESGELKPEKKTPEKEREHIAFQRDDRPPKDEIVKEPEKQPMKVEKLATPEKESEITENKYLPCEPEQKPSPKKLSPVKKTEMSPKGEEKPALQKKAGQLRRDSKEKEEITLKPIELTKKIEMKKTPSPQVEKLKPKAGESVPMERKPSGDIKRLPKKVSPKDSIESITLKKVPKKASPSEEVIKTEKNKLPATKVLSPAVVQMRKISTQNEEEVEELQEEVQEEEDSWGWELVPTDDWEGELEEGAVETPGFGGRRGESLAEKYQH
ncbi:uncharacterized protein LOC143100804 [Alosa pseudoharengus]|uniref:uncharacterized protein LOC143100804 n=1 Tax=Alosa pseudoharengus TaxID=34774 RepID=UPI003F88C17C